MNTTKQFRAMLASLASPVLVVLGVLITPGYGSALTFDLNCVLTSTGCTPSASYGTITITDNGDNVTIVVDLVGTDNKIQGVWLNYDDSLFSNSSDFQTVNNGGDIGVEVNENATQADGHTAGFFDLHMPEPPPGNLGDDPFSDQITLASVNLDPDNFDFTTLSGLFAAVHIGNLFCTDQAAGLCTPGQGGPDSLFVGSTSGDTSTTTTQVPEPSTLFLLGSGLLFLVRVTRRMVLVQR